MGTNTTKKARRGPPWEHLTVLREKDGYNKTEFAKAAGISLSYLSELESGVRNPTPALIAKFAEVLNVPKSLLEPTRRAA